MVATPGDNQAKEESSVDFGINRDFEQLPLKQFGARQAEGTCEPGAQA